MAHEEGGPKDARDRKLAADFVQLLQGHVISESIHVAATLGIANILVDGPKTIEDLAAETKTHAPALYRVMRALASLGVFAEREDGRFTLTPLAQFLRSDVEISLRAISMLFGGEAHSRLMGNLLYSVKTGDAAFKRVFGLEVSDAFRQNLRAAELFSSGMSGVARRNLKELVQTYDFSSLTRIVDVGGGNGRLISLILKTFPQMRGVLFNSPDLADAAHRAISAADLDDRCEVVSGDMFKQLPQNGDAYILWNVVRDLDDYEAIALFGVIRKAMARKGKLLLLETVIPPGNSPSPSKLLDLIYLIVLGGSSRTERQFRDLYAEAGFNLTRIVPVPSVSGMSVIEGNRS